VSTFCGRPTIDRFEPWLRARSRETNLRRRHGPPRPAVFIDKDGTLVENVPYNVDPARLRFVPGAGAALRRLASHGYALVLATNQSGLARGLFDAAQWEQLVRTLRRRLLELWRVELLDVVMCPHAPAPDGSPRCGCRKPAPGLLLRAAQRHRIDLARSWMIGDTLDDVEAGRRAGCRAVLFDSGGETEWRLTTLRTPTARLVDWPAVAQLITGGVQCAQAAAPR
jgi:D-glycero-D-manno-heptose 1,7-bisphosphate phosphatase